MGSEMCIRDRDKLRQDSKLLDPANAERNENMKLAYVGILKSMGLVIKSLQMAKFLHNPPPTPEYEINVTRLCSKCQNPVKDSWRMCTTCKFGDRGHLCCLCHRPMKGYVAACLACGHAGHPVHLQEWFKTRENCPTGCGCKCLAMMSM